jgi:hypothetical protein
MVLKFQTIVLTKKEINQEQESRLENLPNSWPLPDGWIWAQRKISIQDNYETGVNNERTILGVFKNQNHDPAVKGSERIKFFVIAREGGPGGITRQDEKDLIAMLAEVLENE